MTTRVRFPGLAVLALLAACHSDSGVGPSTSTPVDLANVFRELSVPGMTTATTLAGGVALPFAGGIPSGCAYVSASQSFVCPTVTSSGLTMTASYSLFNAAGQPMAEFNANTVASVRVKSTIAGTITTDGTTLTIDGQQDQTVSGLQSSTHTLNGTSTMNVSGAGSATMPGPFSLRSTTTIGNLVLPANGGANGYPTSGTVTVDQVSTFFGGPSVTSKVVMTFNGTSKVNVTVTLEGKALSSCTLDLASGTPACG